MSAERQKIRAAEWLYRWNLSMSILGIVFTILTFVGVFTLVLHQYFAEFGLDEAEVLLVLLAVVLVIIFGFGFYLDKFLRFWSAQTTVATVRNQFLTSALYQKELLIMKYSQIPQMEGLLHLIEELPDSPRRRNSSSISAIRFENSGRRSNPRNGKSPPRSGPTEPGTFAQPTRPPSRRGSSRLESRGPDGRCGTRVRRASRRRSSF